MLAVCVTPFGYHLRLPEAAFPDGRAKAERALVTHRPLVGMVQREPAKTVSITAAVLASADRDLQIGRRPNANDARPRQALGIHLS